MDWLDLLAVQGILKSLLQHHSSKALSLFWVLPNPSQIWSFVFLAVAVTHATGGEACLGSSLQNLKPDFNLFI